MKKMIIVLYSVLLTACGDKEFKCPGNFIDIQIIAHRGVSYQAPENGLKALTQAIDMGLNAIEFDIQMTKDGELVVFHDDNLYDRTGINGFIGEYTVSEIKQFRLFNRFGHITDDRIPTLGEVLELIGNKIYCFIEIKDIRISGQNNSFHNIEIALTKELEKYNIDTRMATILSFEKGRLLNFYTYNNSMITYPLCLLLYDKNLPPLNSPDPMNDEDLKSYEFLSALAIHYNLCDKNIVSNLKNKVQVESIYVYTPNSIKNIPSECFQWIDGIITDNPEAWTKQIFDCQ